MKLLCTLNDPDLCKNKCFHFFHFEFVYSSALVIFSKVIISGSNNDTLFPFKEKLEVHLLSAKFEEMATLLNLLTKPKNQTDKVVLVHTFHGYTCLATTEVRPG